MMAAAPRARTAAPSTPNTSVFVEADEQRPEDADQHEREAAVKHPDWSRPTLLEACRKMMLPEKTSVSLRSPISRLVRP